VAKHLPWNTEDADTAIPTYRFSNLQILRLMGGRMRGEFMKVDVPKHHLRIHPTSHPALETLGLPAVHKNTHNFLFLVSSSLSFPTRANENKTDMLLLFLTKPPANKSLTTSRNEH
jgi:hypothetical protein